MKIRIEFPEIDKILELTKGSQSVYYDCENHIEDKNNEIESILLIHENTKQTEFTDLNLTSYDELFENPIPITKAILIPYTEKEIKHQKEMRLFFDNLLKTINELF